MFDLSRQHTPEAGSARRPRARAAKSEIRVVAYGETGGVGMGLLSTGDPFLTQRGLAILCGVRNAHIGTISRDWATHKPRILAIKARLGFTRASAHRVLTHHGHRLYAYDLAIAHAVLDYYALDAGAHVQAEAIRNRARYAGGGLKAHILDRLAAGPAPAPPIRFVPTADDGQDDTNPITAMLSHIWSLYILSFWMAVNHIENLRQRAARAPWNRLGLYLPLTAFLEIQAEALRLNGTFTLR